jgi:hypothetical protein
MTADAMQIVTAARAYVGVPFRHQGRSKWGMDCLGLLIAVAHDCALQRGGAVLWQQDECDYGHYPDAAYLHAQLAKWLRPIATPQLGAVALMQHDGAARHLGILGDYAEAKAFSLIHAYAPAKAVIEHHYSEEWQQQTVALFIFPSPSGKGLG